MGGYAKPLSPYTHPSCLPVSVWAHERAKTRFLGWPCIPGLTYSAPRPDTSSLAIPLDSFLRFRRLKQNFLSWSWCSCSLQDPRVKGPALPTWRQYGFSALPPTYPGDFVCRVAATTGYHCLCRGWVLQCSLHLLRDPCFRDPVPIASLRHSYRFNYSCFVYYTPQLHSHVHLAFNIKAGNAMLLGPSRFKAVVVVVVFVAVVVVALDYLLLWILRSIIHSKAG